ncbi:MAG: glycosyltransferase [Luteitalea sp.]|nr:glycosyltransferase [Luteitalea sp.]
MAAREGDIELLGERLRVRTVRPERHLLRHPDVPHRDDERRHRHDRGLHRLRPGGMGVERQRDGRRRARTRDLLRERWPADHPDPGARGRTRHRSGCAVVHALSQRRPRGDEERHHDPVAHAVATVRRVRLQPDWRKTDMSGSAHIAVLIATYNRAALLGETLDCLAASRPPGFAWEVVVVDNNSTDGTRAVVESRQASYPVALRYVRETRQGRSAALNTAMAATTAPLLVFSDDDVRVDAGWLETAAAALSQGWNYVGGPVRPIWEARPPRWLDLTRSDTWGTIAILDYGAEPFVFEDRRRVPLGCNLGVRRSVIERVGDFRVDLGRSNGKLLLGQEVPEWLARVRAAGLRGLYIPGMVVHHHIPARRLTKEYHRKWWIGKGYSRATLDLIQPVTDQNIDLRRVPHVGALPRFMFTDAVRDVVAYIRALLTGNTEERFRRAMRLAYFLGYVKARGLWRPPSYDATSGAPVGAATSSAAAGL